MKTDLHIETSVVIDFGSGSPIFGLQLKTMAKEVICVDLKIVMNQILAILELSIASHLRSQDLMSTIHLVSQDILTMRIEDLPPVCRELTHLICFIGLPDGKDM